LPSILTAYDNHVDPFPKLKKVPVEPLVEDWRPKEQHVPDRELSLDEKRGLPVPGSLTSRKK